MTLTTPRGIRYPESTDHTRLWEHIQNTATDIDGQLGADVCTAATRPASPTTGWLIYETDTRLQRIWDGSAWQIVGLSGAWYSFTPVCYDGDTTVGAVTAVSGAYTRGPGQTITARGAATFTGATTSGTGLSLPIQAATRVIGIGVAFAVGTSPPATQTGVAYMNVDLAGVSRVVLTSATSAFVNAAAGNTMRYTVTYEAAAGL